MPKAFFLFLLLTLSYVAKGYSPLPPEKPKLIVTIVLDNVSLQDIEANTALFTTKGLLKIKNEGTLFSNTIYPYSVTDPCADFASIATGTSPRHHGIVGQQWYNPFSETHDHCTANKQSFLIGPTEKKEAHTPDNLLASTIGDELKLASFGQSKVWSISLNAQAAILLAGHAADGAYWLDNASGNWVTSDYYMPWLPQWVSDSNTKKIADFYLAQEWTLSKSPSEYYYDEAIYSKNTFPIKINQIKENKSPYSILSSTPMGDMLVTDFAKQLILEEKLGQGDFTDLLFLNYSNVNNLIIDKGGKSIEKADKLVRLDTEIAHLLDVLDKTLGAQNYLIALTSTQLKNYTVEQLQQKKIPSGLFNVDKAEALLNSYLMALHGQGQWVLDFSNKQLFLNRNLIEKSRLNFQDFQENVASFLEEFSGIQWAIPAHKLKYENFSEQAFSAMKASYFTKRSGDILFCYTPGWAEDKGPKSLHYANSNENTSVPLFLYGWKIERNTIASPINITDLAPSIGEILHIAIPNCASQTLIYEGLINK